MSPVGRPAPDGDGVISASRFYRGKTLGAAGPWNCPGCGKQNDGAIERGCVHCGAGDPTKSRAGQPTDQPLAPSPELARAAAEDLVSRAKSAARQAKEAGGNRVVAAGEPKAHRILRLIEYLIHPGESADEVLRRSLVGRMDFPWGTLTGTIVDSADVRQEDLLQLARKQPGVWLANPTAMEGVRPAPTRLFSPADTQRLRDDLVALEQERRYRMGTPLPPADLPGPTILPDTGIAFTMGDKTLAGDLIAMVGYKIAHTFALALSTVAEELDASADAERLMTRDEALRLAQAILFLIPDDWLSPELPALPAQAVDPAVQQRIQALREGSKPTVTPWRDPTEPGTTKL